MTHQDHICFGGLTQASDTALALRVAQIEQGFRLHTCLDYGASFDTIERAALQTKRPLRLITKVYFNYPNALSPRYRSVYAQVSDIRQRLGARLQDWTLQICSHVPPSALGDSVSEFAQRVRADLGVGKILFETFPDWENDTRRIVAQADADILGYIYYARGGASTGMRQAIEAARAPHAVIGLRGDLDVDKGAALDLGISAHLARTANPGFQYTVTAARTQSQMDDLLSRLDAAAGSPVIEPALEQVFQPARDPYAAKRKMPGALADPRWLASRAIGRIRKGFATRGWM